MTPCPLQILKRPLKNLEVDCGKKRSPGIFLPPDPSSGQIVVSDAGAIDLIPLLLESDSSVPNKPARSGKWPHSKLNTDFGFQLKLIGLKPVHDSHFIEFTDVPQEKKKTSMPYIFALKDEVLRHGEINNTICTHFVSLTKGKTTLNFTYGRESTRIHPH
jgi:hypothetical protein